MGLSREAIAAAQDWTIEEVPVPAWGGTVHVRSMMCRDMEHMQTLFLRLGDDASVAARQDPEALLQLRVTLLSYCLCDAQGALLFNDDAGREILAQKHHAVIEALFPVAMRLNNLSQEAVDAEKKDSPTPAIASVSSSAVVWDGVSPSSTPA
jgi:hypothetical protein